MSLPKELDASMSAAPGAPPLDLAALRTELDRIDDALHDLLIRRAAEVSKLAASGMKGRTALRPGREAAILRRLLARHEGALPPQTIVRIWRELFAGTTAMQGPFTVAVCQPDESGGAIQAAREQFGALTPMRLHRSAAQTLADVGGGAAVAGVLPLPSETEAPRDAWWTTLTRRGTRSGARAEAGGEEPRLFVVGRLPFWAARPEGGSRAQALVVAAVPPDESGHDRSLLGLELALDVSRARLTGTVIAAGLRPETMILRRDPGASVAHALIDVDGFISENDERLGGLAVGDGRPTLLGAYALAVGPAR